MRTDDLSIGRSASRIGRHSNLSRVLRAGMIALLLAVPAAHGGTTFGPQQLIAIPEMNGPVTAVAADLDGDGDQDVLAASIIDDKMAWYENTDGQGNFGPQRIIGTTGAGSGSVFAADLDGDGDQDVLSAARTGNAILWYPNTDGKGAFATSPLIVDAAVDAGSALAADLDGDGDLDVLATARGENTLAWYANDGAGHFGSLQRISDATYAVERVAAADLDGDGDLDLFCSGESALNRGAAIYKNTDGKGTFGQRYWVDRWGAAADAVFVADLDGDADLDALSASAAEGTLTWYKNRDGSGPSDDTIIAERYWGASSVFAADLDADGDLDLLSTRSSGGTVEWFTNTDGKGSFGSAQVIDDRAWGATSASAADLDGDGDLDLLAAANRDDAISWYENTEGTGQFGPPRPITASVSSAAELTAADVDADGDPDLLSTSSYDGELVWYENSGGPKHFGPPRHIADDVMQLHRLAAGDLDGDGDADLLASSPNGGTVAWYANSDGLGDFRLRQVIQIDANLAKAKFLHISDKGHRIPGTFPFRLNRGGRTHPAFLEKHCPCAYR